MDISKDDKFIPRDFPEKILKPLPPKKGGEKWILFLLVGSLVLTLGFWLYGRIKNEGFNLRKPGVASITLVPTPTISAPKTDEIVTKIKNLTSGLRGSYGVSVYNLTTKKSYGFAEDEVFPAASLIKLPVILTLYQEQEAGRIDLETKYTLKNTDKQPGAGSMQYKPVGTVYTYRKMIELMGQQSDNTAFFVLRQILGDQKIQVTINKLGMAKTSLEKNETSPADIGLFFRKLYAGSVVSRPNRDEILDFLTKTAFEDRIPAGVPKEIRVAHKIGNEIGVLGDAGIVFAPKPFILVILSKNILEKEAREVLPKITAEVWLWENK